MNASTLLFSLFFWMLSASVLGQALDPHLTIRSVANGQFEIAWPAQMSGFVLESSDSLGAANWQSVTNSPFTRDAFKVLTIVPSKQHQFFRLREPSTELTTIRATSPVEGETGVSVTRETVIYFTAPLAAGATVDNDHFFASFGGRRILARVELSGDRTKASLFYLEPLPGNARVTVTFVGDSILDAHGLAVDADDDGEPGGTATVQFETFSLSALPGTAVTGYVYDSALAANGSDKPLPGVTLTVDGMEQTLRTVTGADGSFTLSPVPPGRFFVHIDGRTIADDRLGIRYPDKAYYPYVGKAWDAVAGKTNNLAGGTGKIYLPVIVSGTLQPVSAVQDTTISFPASVLASNAALAGVSLTVPANSLFSDNGSRGGRVGLAPVPPDRLPGPLPPGLKLPLVITVQTDGALNFDKPAPVCFPNLPDPDTGLLPQPGTKRVLISFNHKKGIWEDEGGMTVSADGKLVCSDPGVGIVQPGWHGNARRGPAPAPEPPKRWRCEEAPDQADPDQDVKCNRGCLDAYERRKRSADALFAAQARDCLNLEGESQADCLARVASSALDMENYIHIQDDRCRRGCDECFGSGTGGLRPANKPASRMNALASSDSQIVATVIQAVDQARNLAFALPTAPAEQSQVLQQIRSLLDAANQAAGGDAASFIASVVKSMERDALNSGEDLRFDDMPDDAPPYAVSYAAVLKRGGTTLVLRGQTEPFGEYELFVPGNAELLYVRFYDARTGSYAVIRPYLSPELALILPRFRLTPLSATARDSDHDGLADVVEEVIGTDPENPDSDSDGISDGAEIVQGTNPLDGVAVNTGVIATAATPGSAVDVYAGGELVATAEGTNGISIFPIYRGVNPTILSHVPLAGNVRRISGDGSVVVGVSTNGGLSILDATSPGSVRLTYQVPITGAEAVVASGGIAFVGTAAGQIFAVDLLSGGSRATTNVAAAVQDLALEGDYLYALTADRVYILSYSDDSLQVVSSVPSVPDAGVNQRLFVGGGVAYTVDRNGYNTIDVSDALKPQFISAGKTGQFGWRQIVANGAGLGIAAVGPNSTDDGRHDISLYDVSSPRTNDAFLTTFPMPGSARAVALYNGLAYVASDSAGLQVVNYLPYDRNGIPPRISLTASFPTNGVEEGKFARASAVVSDDIQIRNVEFYLDGNRVSSDGSFPFEFRFVVPSRNATNAAFRLRARAIDTGGNATWSDELLVPLLPDRTAPVVTRVSPIGGSKAPNALFASFSEPIAPQALTPSSISLVGFGADGQLGTADDVVVRPTTIAYTAEARTVQFLLSGALAPGRYQATLSSNIIDLAGNKLSQDYVWTFRVADAVFWTGGSGAWNDPLNWSSGSVPGPDDDVIIDVPGNAVVTLSRGVGLAKTLLLNNPLLVQGGALSRMTITQLNGPRLEFNSSTDNALDAVTLSGALDLTGGGYVRIRSGFGFSNGTIQLGRGAILAFEGDQTLESGVIEMGADLSVATLGLVGQTQLTLGPGVTIHGSAGRVGASAFGASSQQSLINRGRIISDLAGPSMTVSAVQFLNAGLAGATNGGVLLISSAAWTNSGTLRAAAGGVLTLQGAWNNSGEIQVDNGSLTMGSLNQGALSAASIGVIRRSGGTVSLAAPFDNSGRTLAFDDVSGDWVLAGGTILGGTVRQSGSAGLRFVKGVLDGVTVEGDLVVTNGGSVLIRNTLKLSGSPGPGGAVRLDRGAVLGFDGNQAFGPGAVLFEDAGSSSTLGLTGGTVLTLNSNVLIRGKKGNIGSIVSGGNGGDSVTLINGGTLVADGASAGAINITAGQFLNQGQVIATNAARLVVLSAVWTNSSTFQVETNATLTLQGSWTNAGTLNLRGGFLNLGSTAPLSLSSIGTIQRAGGVVNLATVLDNANRTLVLDAISGSLSLTSGSILGGMVVQREGAQLLFGSGINVLDGVTIDGDLDLRNGGAVRVRHGLNLISGGNPGAVVRLDNRAALGFEGETTFGPGTIELAGGSTLGIVGNSTLTLAVSTLVHGAGNVGSPTFDTSGTQTLVNEGTIMADVQNQTLTINPKVFANHGATTTSNGGKLVLPP